MTVKQMSRIEKAGKCVANTSIEGLNVCCDTLCCSEKYVAKELRRMRVEANRMLRALNKLFAALDAAEV